MKKDIHPEYKMATVVCGCGNTFQTRSTKSKITIEVCNVCHPLFTGQQKYIDSAGLVVKFQKKWGQQIEEQIKKATEAISKKTKETSPS